MDRAFETQRSDVSRAAPGVAVVTGAAGAIGRSTVARLLTRGARVVAVDSNEAARSAFQNESAVTFVSADLSKAAGVQAVVDRIGSEMTDVQILVNNVGILSNHKLGETDYAEWRHVLAVNLDAAFLLSQQCAPAMRKKGFGRIVNMCSLAMKTGGLTAGTAYTVSKGALAALTLSLARELAPTGVTVNAIAPAYVRSPMIMEQLDEAQRQALLATIPVGRFCEPEEIAHAVDFLVSPLSGFITGEILNINGGLHFD